MSQPIQPQQPYGQQPQQHPIQQQPLPQYVPAKRKRFGWVALVITALVSLGVGGAVAGSGDSTTTAEPAPTVTVTATPKPAPTTTKTVADVPQACLDALDDADKGFDIAADMLGVTQATFEIIVDGLRSGEFDIDGINEQTDKLTKLTDRLGVVGDRYNPEKAECRAAAE